MSAPAKKPAEPSPALDLVGLIADAVFEEFLEGMKLAKQPATKDRPNAEEASAANR